MSPMNHGLKMLYIFCLVPFPKGGGFIEEIQPFRELMRPFGTNSPGNLRFPRSSRTSEISLILVLKARSDKLL